MDTRCARDGRARPHGGASRRAGPAAIVLAVLLVACAPSPEGEPAAPPLAPITDRPPVHGRLVLAVYGDDERAAAAPVLQRWELVNGRGYGGMEDNDLRGNLDGTFKWGWNQPGQVHVRLGRRGRGPMYGEHELFRVLYRWAELGLPSGARVHEARMALAVEDPPEFPLRLMLYEVKRDWDPGHGGVAGDNVSPPAEGEVWWNDVAHGRRSWGLPGAGFASDSHPEADTAEMPLAEAICAPDATHVTFAGPRLDAYVAGRVAEGRPVLFLLKLSDHQEDLPGTMIAIYSGNHGHSRDVRLRPRLTLTWDSPAQLAAVERDVLLEHGRRLSGGRVAVGAGATVVAASFVAAEGSSRPTLELRGAPAGHGPGVWKRVPLAVESPEAWDWLEWRLLGSPDPVWLGQPFTAGLHDTWIRSAPPEAQRVPWTFVSPTGREHVVEARYVGDWRWQVRFTPDEVGPWRYRWEQRFTGTPYRSPVGEFDVLVRDRQAALDALAELAARIREAGEGVDERLRLAFMVRFSRLERAALALESPDSFSDDPGLRDRLAEVRALLGEPVPEEIPLEPSPPPEWAAEEE